MSLRITIPGVETFNDDTQRFSTEGELLLELEHSLVSLSKWEAKYKKAFLGRDEKTSEEVLGYFKVMGVDGEIPDETIARLSQDNVDQINAYLGDSMTATWFSENPNQRPSRETLTNELIYYYMLTLNVPREYENWHLSRLFTLLKVISLKNSAQKKMSPQEAARKQSELNAQRLAKSGSSG